MVTHSTDRTRDALAVTVTVLVAAAAVGGVSLTAVGSASAAPTGIDECTTSTEPGAYELRADLGVEGETCLAVEANDVTVDGNGDAIERTAPDGDPPPDYRESAAVVVGGSEPVTNVTVTNATVRVESLDYGEVTTDAVAYRNASDSALTDVRLDSRVWAFVEVVGSNDTVRNVTHVERPNRGAYAVFRIEGDDTVLRTASRAPATTCCTPPPSSETGT